MRAACVSVCAPVRVRAACVLVLLTRSRKFWHWTPAATVALWLLAASNPDNERYTDDGTLYPGPQRSQVVPALVRDQRKIAALAHSYSRL
jgi:hypothetical protein